MGRYRATDHLSLGGEVAAPAAGEGAFLNRNASLPLHLPAPPDAFPQLCVGGARSRSAAPGAGGAERGGQDQSARGDLAAFPRPGPEGRQLRRGGGPGVGRRLGGGGDDRDAGRAGRYRHRRRRQRRRPPGADQRRQCPHHRGDERLSARALADPGDGRAVHRAGGRPAALPRPAGDDADPRPFGGGRRFREGDAAAQPAARRGGRPALDRGGGSADGGGGRRGAPLAHRQPRRAAGADPAQRRRAELSGAGARADAPVRGPARAALRLGARGRAAGDLGPHRGAPTAPPAAP